MHYTLKAVTIKKKREEQTARALYSKNCWNPVRLSSPVKSTVSWPRKSSLR